MSSASLFVNPFLAPFTDQLPTAPASARTSYSISSDQTLVFQDDFQNAIPGADLNTPEPAALKFQNNFRNRISSPKSLFFQECCAYEGEPLYEKGSYDIDRDGYPPLSLILRRKGNTNTNEIIDPTTNEVYYNIYETCRGLFSVKPDLEIYRPTYGESPIGTVRYGVLSHQMVCNSTCRTWKLMDEYKSPVTNEYGSYLTSVWSKKKLQRQSSKIRWPKLDGAGFPQEPMKRPLVTLELGQPGPLGKPFCSVKLHHPRPYGELDIWVDNACANNPEGRWSALDELVISAYANIEKIRRDVMDGVITWEGRGNRLPGNSSGNMFGLPGYAVVA